MPVLKIQTNIEISKTKHSDILSQASSLVANKLGKPESYVMVVLEPQISMLFAGNDQPLAYIELKSIGLPESATKKLSQTLCEFIEANLSIDKSRVYIEFADAPRNMWGWNGGTFG